SSSAPWISCAPVTGLQKIAPPLKRLKRPMSPAVGLSSVVGGPSPPATPPWASQLCQMAPCTSWVPAPDWSITPPAKPAMRRPRPEVAAGVGRAADRDPRLRRGRGVVDGAGERVVAELVAGAGHGQQRRGVARAERSPDAPREHAREHREGPEPMVLVAVVEG